MLLQCLSRLTHQHKSLVFYLHGICSRYIAQVASQEMNIWYQMLFFLRIKHATSGAWFNIKMSCQYLKSHYGDKTILRPSYLHNGISYTGKATPLYWIRALDQWCYFVWSNAFSGTIIIIIIIAIIMIRTIILINNNNNDNNRYHYHHHNFTANFRFANSKCKRTTKSWSQIY